MRRQRSTQSQDYAGRPQTDDRHVVHNRLRHIARSGSEFWSDLDD